MTFSSLKQISSSERTSRLLNQPTIAKVSKINDRIAEAGEQGFDFFLCALVVARNKQDSSRLANDRVRFQVWNDDGVQCLDYAGARDQRRNKLAGRQIADIGGLEFAGPAVKWIRSIDQNLVVPLRQTHTESMQVL